MCHFKPTAISVSIVVTVIVIFVFLPVKLQTIDQLQQVLERRFTQTSDALLKRIEWTFEVFVNRLVDHHFEVVFGVDLFVEDFVGHIDNLNQNFLVAASNTFDFEVGVLKPKVLFLIASLVR